MLVRLNLFANHDVAMAEADVYEYWHWSHDGNEVSDYWDKCSGKRLG